MWVRSEEAMTLPRRRVPVREALSGPHHLQRAIRRADQGRARRDDVDRHPFQQVPQSPLAAKRAHEPAIFERRQDVSRNAAAEVDAPRRKHLQPEIARLGTQDRDEYLDRRLAQRVGTGRVEGGRGHHGIRVGCDGELGGQFGRLGGVAAIAKIAVDVRNTDARADALVADVVGRLQHVLEQPDLEGGGWREVAMAAL